MHQRITKKKIIKFKIQIHIINQITKISIQLRIIKLTQKVKKYWQIIIVILIQITATFIIQIMIKSLLMQISFHRIIFKILKKLKFIINNIIIQKLIIALKSK